MSILNLRRVECQLVDRERKFELCLEALNVLPGSRVAVVGPSGCGKTTLLETLALLRSCNHADEFILSTENHTSIDVNSHWCRKKMDSLRQIRAEYIGFIPSDGGLFPALTIRENSRLRSYLAGRSESFTRKAIVRLSKSLELSNNDLDAPLMMLSRGQKIRGAILHGLIHNPRLIIADEPTSALHPALAKSVMTTLIDEMVSSDGAVVVSTHDLGLVENLNFNLVRGIPEADCSLNRTLFQ